MSAELDLISKVLAEGTTQRLVEKKVKPAMFAEMRAEYDMILGHYESYGQMPTVETMRRYFPNFTPEASLPEPVDFYIDELRDKRKYGILANALRGSGRLLGEDTAQAQSMLEAALQQIYTEIGEMRDVSWTATTADRREDYLRREAQRGMFGIMTPWQRLNDLTLGFQREQLITVAARPKRGKSWWMVLCALAAVRQHRRVMLVTMEMSPTEIQRRADACYGQFGYRDFRKALLGDLVRERYFEVLGEISMLDGQMVITGDSDAKGQVGSTFLDAKVRQYRPDIMFIDGVYLLHDERNGKSKTEKMYNLSQDLKRLTRRFEIPCVVSTQMGRDGENQAGGQSSIQWSDSWAQDCMVGETLIDTDKGLVPIRNLVRGGCRLRAFGQVKDFVCVNAGVKESFAVMSKGREILRCSGEHVVLAVKDGMVKWVKAQDLLAGDSVLFSNDPSPKGDDLLPELELPVVSSSKSIRIPSKVDQDLAWLIGVFVGDGSSNVSTVSLHCGYDEGYGNEVLRIVKEKFGLAGVKRYQKTRLSKGKQLSVCWYSKELYNWFRSFIGYPKLINVSWIGWSYANRLSLIAGLVDSDGYVNRYGAISYCSSIKANLDMFALLVNSCGLVSTVKDSAHVLVSSVSSRDTSIPLRFKEIPVPCVKNDFSVPKDLARNCSREYVKRTGFRWRSRLLSGDDKKLGFLLKKGISGRGFGSSTWWRLSPEFNGMIPLEVTRVLPVGREEMFDIQVLSEDKRIVANQVVVHNSDSLIELFQNAELRERRIMRIILQTQREGEVGSVDVNWNLDTMDFGESADLGDRNSALTRRNPVIEI